MNTDGEGWHRLVRETDTDLDGCSLVVIGAGPARRWCQAWCSREPAA